MPAHADHIQQERPTVELAVDRALLTNRRDNVIEDIPWNVIVPWLDHIRLNHRGHLDERSLTNIDVPGTLALLGFSNKAFNPEPLHRSNLVIHIWEP